jgi:hypothetical protein
MQSRSLRRLAFLFAPAILAIMFLATSAALAQTTGFTYQGRLTDGGTSANGNYDLQFALFDSLSGGTQVGSTQTLNTVAVNNGVFTVSLDFGANAFPGASRFLEISARPAGSGSFTLLSPRQPITSTPYAVRSLNATSADNVTVNGNQAFSVTGAGTGSFANSNTFVGVGAGTANTPEGNGNGSRNSFFGKDAGRNNTTGFHNSFFGSDAGANSTGERNSFFGALVGLNNTTGIFNSFFGAEAGVSNTTGSSNSFFGLSAGRFNTSGSLNSFFGLETGHNNTTGGGNSFFGSAVGLNNTTGERNSFFGLNAGVFNTTGNSNSFFGDHTGQRATGSLNTFIGANADFAAVQDMSPSGNRNTLLGANAALGSGGMFSPDNATAIGANARVDQANSLVLGSINGVNFATADTKVGIGTTTPTARLSVVATGDGARVLHLGTERSWVFKQLGTGAETALELTGNDPSNNNKNFLINTTGFVGVGTTAPTDPLSVNGSANKPGGGSWTVFSDERLKNIKGRFTSGLNAVMQLQPLRYEYKRDNALKLKPEGEHVGFSAQAVQKIIPEAVTSTAQGYLLVNNDPILWTMLNAIKEQQAQIATLQQVNSALTARLQRVEQVLRKNSFAARRR